MMGHSHALSGAVLWLAAVPTSTMLVGHPLPLVEELAGTLACAGAALVPDLDHPDGTIAHFFGPPSRALARIVERLSGGHRHGTHTVPFAASAGIGTLGLVLAGHHIALILLLLLVALALRALRLTPHARGIGGLLAATPVVVVVATSVHGYWWWLPPAVALGCIAHLAGDAATREGIRPLVPFSRRHFRYARLITGHWQETKLIMPAMTVVALGEVGWLVWPLLNGYWARG